MDSEAATESADLSQVRPDPKLDFFAAISDLFGSSVWESIFTYQVEVFKQRCITQRLLAAVIVLLPAVVVRKGGGGQWHYDHWSGGQWAAPRQLLARDLTNMHVARCVITPKAAKASLMLLPW